MSTFSSSVMVFSAAVLVDSSDREILEIVVMAGQLRRLGDHAASPGSRRRIRLARRKPTMRLPSRSKPSVRQVTMPFLGSPAGQPLLDRGAPGDHGRSGIYRAVIDEFVHPQKRAADLAAIFDR